MNDKYKNNQYLSDLRNLLLNEDKKLIKKRDIIYKKLSKLHEFAMNNCPYKKGVGKYFIQSREGGQYVEIKFKVSSFSWVKMKYIYKLKSPKYKNNKEFVAYEGEFTIDNDRSQKII